MDNNSYIDDFLIPDADFAVITHVPDFPGPLCMDDVQQRYDVFRPHRDEFDMNIIELTMSWSSPAPLLYDWYRTNSGWTVSLEAPASLSRPWGVPITIRVRHEVDAKESTLHKLGRTWTFDERDPALLERVRREILEAFCEGESPLWRLRRHFDLPPYIVAALEEEVDQEMAVGLLELETTRVLVTTMLLHEDQLVHAMHACPSFFRRRST